MYSAGLTAGPPLIRHLLTLYLRRPQPFSPSHCECNAGWLEPLLDRIHKDPRTAATPVIDVLDSVSGIALGVLKKSSPFFMKLTWLFFYIFLSLQNNFKYVTADASTQRGIFTWYMQFAWGEVTHQMRQERASHIDPMTSPTMAGGLFAMRKVQDGPHLCTCPTLPSLKPHLLLVSL